MKQLYSLCRVDTKIWKEFPNGDHNATVAQPGYFAAIDQFIKDQIANKN